MSEPAHSRQLLDRIAGVLGDLALEIEGLGGELCGDPDIAIRHCEQLQSIDVVAQTARHLAGILGSSDPAETVSEINLETLRRALLASGRSLETAT
ncbi:MAG: hypothetical protein WA936_06530 [Erythrobacter sp.]|uniref:hypothetical protein n=1 Tax=Erythrobacter sp. TaxID=1042 RepID=UPI003C783A3C